MRLRLRRDVSHFRPARGAQRCSHSAPWSPASFDNWFELGSLDGYDRPHDQCESCPTMGPGPFDYPYRRSTRSGHRVRSRARGFDASEFDGLAEADRRVLDSPSIRCGSGWKYVYVDCFLWLRVPTVRGWSNAWPDTTRNCRVNAAIHRHEVILPTREATRQRQALSYTPDRAAARKKTLIPRRRRQWAARTSPRALTRRAPAVTVVRDRERCPQYRNQGRRMWVHIRGPSRARRACRSADGIHRGRVTMPGVVDWLRRHSTPALTRGQDGVRNV